MKKIKKVIGTCIWCFSEYFHISLGNYAAVVFGWKLGYKGEKFK